MAAILVSMSAALAEDRIRCAYPYWFGMVANQGVNQQP